LNENKNNLNNNILITGGAGYIGSCLALYLKKKYRITILDKKKYYQNNILATKNLITAMKNHNLTNLIFSSTAAVINILSGNLFIKYFFDFII